MDDLTTKVLCENVEKLRLSCHTDELQVPLRRVANPCPILFLAVREAEDLHRAVSSASVGATLLAAVHDLLDFPPLQDDIEQDLPKAHFSAGAVALLEAIWVCAERLRVTALHGRL